MPMTYILQQLDELKKRIESLSCNNKENRKEIERIKDRIRLLEQPDAVYEDE